MNLPMLLARPRRGHTHTLVNPSPVTFKTNYVDRARWWTQSFRPHPHTTMTAKTTKTMTTRVGAKRRTTRTTVAAQRRKRKRKLHRHQFPSFFHNLAKPAFENYVPRHSHRLGHHCHLSSPAAPTIAATNALIVSNCHNSNVATLSTYWSPLLPSTRSPSASVVTCAIFVAAASVIIVIIRAFWLAHA